MKLLKIFLLTFLLFTAITVHAEDKDAQVKPLMDKIISLLKADRASEALPYMAKLEGMELDLSDPLPESFYYYYIDTLDKAGEKDKALSRGKVYLKKFGQGAKHYSQVSEIVNSASQSNADPVANLNSLLKSGIRYKTLADDDGAVDSRDEITWTKMRVSLKDCKLTFHTAFTYTDNTNPKPSLSTMTDTIDLRQFDLDRFRNRRIREQNTIDRRPYQVMFLDCMGNECINTVSITKERSSSNEFILSPVDNMPAAKAIQVEVIKLGMACK